MNDIDYVEKQLKIMSEENMPIEVNYLDDEKAYIYRARPVKRAINNHIINGITMKILAKEIVKEKEILVSANDDGFVFSNIVEEERTTVSSDETTFA